MATHATAMVKREIFRPSKGTGGASVYDYGSDQTQLHHRVADGRTLWLITSTRKAKQPRRYHLAYKLVNCMVVRPEESIFSGKWKYVVRAQDWGQSRHFGYNDATDTVRRLQFTSTKAMSEVSNIGLRLLSIAEFKTEDVELLQRLLHKIKNSRAVFISYSRADGSYAAKIELPSYCFEMSLLAWLGCCCASRLNIHDTQNMVFGLTSSSRNRSWQT